jgi:hypothetical protein
VTLVEFLAPVRDASHREKCMAVLYFKARYEQIESLTAEQVKQLLVHSRMPRATSMNVADVFNKSGDLVDSPGHSGKARLWRITLTGEAHIRKILGLPEAQPELEHSVASLEALAAKVSNPGVRHYVDESIKCLRFDALRAAVVFLWAGAVYVLREACVAKGLPQVNAAVRVHDTKAREIKKSDDFAYIKESVLLLAAEGLGILDKSERSTLDEALGLRNKCGHPTKYNPGILKACGFVEDLLGVVLK